MGLASKSPVAVAREALAVGEASLPRFGHKHSPKRYTQAQLFATLVLKQFFRTDYRGIIAILEDSRELRAALRLKRLPHFTTLCQAARRFEKRGAGQASCLRAWQKLDHGDSSEEAVAAPSTPPA